MKKRTKRNIKNDNISNIIIVIMIIFSLFSLGYSLKLIFFQQESNTQTTQQSTAEMPRASKMSLTPYDKELARHMMDKNNDGKCDACGMPVEMCIDSGQLQCNMDHGATIGILGSQHIHADWKIYVNEKPLDLSDKVHMDRMKVSLPVSSFIHVDSSPNAQEKAGDVLHMHAKGVPLWIFFESLGMKFNKECLILDTKEKYCNDRKKTIKLFTNGKLNNQYENYVFNDLDKLLISYGDESQQEIKEQLVSITGYAKDH